MSENTGKYLAQYSIIANSITKKYWKVSFKLMVYRSTDYISSDTIDAV